MGLGKAFQKLFHGGQQDKDADEERGRAPQHVRSQSALSWRQLRTRSKPRPSAPLIPILNIDKLLSRESRRFDTTVTKELLSHIMLWYLYWDIVEMPDDPDGWYADYGDREEMICWIRLGFELDQHGLQLPRVLRGVCRDLNIDGTEVQRRLIRLSKPGIMVKTEIAEWGMAVIVGAEHYAKKLKRDRDLVANLQPDPTPLWLLRQKQIIAGINFFLDNLFVPTTAPSDSNGAQLRNQAHVNWGRQGGPRPHPPAILYERALPGTAFLDDRNGAPSVRRSISRTRGSFTFPRPATPFNGDEEHAMGLGNGNLRSFGDERRRSTASLEDLTSFANRMNAHMTNKMDALAGNLEDRIAQLQKEVLQLRSQSSTVNNATADGYTQSFSNGHGHVPDLFEPIHHRSRSQDMEPADDTMDVRDHLHYRGCLSQAARKRSTRFADVWPQTPVTPKFDGHSSFVELPRPSFPSHHRRNHSAELGVPTSELSSTNGSTPYDYTNGTGHSSLSVHTGASRCMSPSQYSPTAESEIQRAGGTFNRLNRVRTRRSKWGEYTLGPMTARTQGSSADQDSSLAYNGIHSLRVTNGYPPDADDCQSPPGTGVIDQQRAQSPSRKRSVEPFPAFDPTFQHSYPDFGNPFAQEHHLRSHPLGFLNETSNAAAEAGSSYSWRSPRTSPLHQQVHPQPEAHQQRALPITPSSDLSLSAGSSGEDGRKVDSANGGEEAVPQPSSAKVPSVGGDAVPTYEVLRATREVLAAEKRLCEIEGRINWGRRS